MADEEQWRAVVGWEGWYEVSNLGRIRRARKTNNTYVGRIRWPTLYRGGYAKVNLSRDGKREARRIHRLVAEAFLGPCPAGHEVNHKNGDKDDNRAVNLQWASHSDNQRHAFATGLQRPSSGRPIDKDWEGGKA